MTTMTNITNDKEFLEEIVKKLVANPNDVRVERTVDEMGVLLSLNVNPADIGYVIGKEGQTITSLRTLVRIVGAKNNSRTTIKVIEPEGSRGPRPRTDRPDRDGASRPTSRPASRPAAPVADDIDTSIVDGLDI